MADNRAPQFPSVADPQYIVQFYAFSDDHVERQGDTNYSYKQPAPNYLGVVGLPLPASIADSNGHLWSEYSITNSVSELAGAASSGAASSSRLGKYAEGVSSALGTAATLTSTDGAINKLSRRTTGVGLDPNTRMEYTGEGLRSFSFTFNLIPESANDSATITQIIQFFRIHGTGKKTSDSEGALSSVASALNSASQTGAANFNAFIAEPDYFIIVFGDGEKNPLNNMLRITEVVLKDIAITVFDNGYADVYRDGFPKSISLNLSFTERFPKYSGDWQ